MVAVGEGPAHYSVSFLPMKGGAAIIFYQEEKKASKNEQSAGDAKSEFLANMSHEMRTPINAVSAMTEIALKTDDPARKDYCLKRIDEASKHLLGLINDILDMSKMEAGKLSLSSSEFSFEEMLAKSAGFIDFPLREKRQILTVEIAPDIPKRVISDEGRFSQVITNLLSNAVKFTPSLGKISLRASLSQLKGDICEIRVDVTDTGIGISQADKSRLFKSFEQADGGISRNYGGAGLGLAISKRIVELMGGSIWVESRPGRGSRFSFTAKVLKGAEALENIPESNGMAGNIKGVFRGFRILLAEDIDINREIVIALLEETGIAIDCAANGLSALSMFKKSPGKYDLILMDIHMPGLSGFDAARSIRVMENHWAKAVPILAMTADVFKEDVESCKRAGMNGHIAKPLSHDLLIGELKKHLARRGEA
jgi:two-component system sensor histidine kinase/response regulator